MKVTRRGRVWIASGLALLLILVVPLPISLAAPTNRTIRLEASRFQYAPAELHVNPGDRVTLEVVSTDVVHGLSIDGYNLSLTADPGQTSRLTFIADRPGAFRFRCSVTCGNMHPFMIGKLYVGPNILLYRAAALAVLSILTGLWMLWK
ncbi:MAG TPA: cupredoxin domain-containing protein [Anaerolineales bacterium]